jgi:hypothetical protein
MLLDLYHPQIITFSAIRFITGLIEIPFHVTRRFLENGGENVLGPKSFYFAARFPLPVR